MIPQAFLSRPVSAATQMKPSLPHQLDQEFLEAQVIWLLDQILYWCRSAGGNAASHDDQPPAA